MNQTLTFPQKTVMPLAITNVTVIPMTKQRVLHNQTVVLENGWIKAVEPSGNVNIDHMQTMDGTGKYLLPGLADMHVHYWMPGDAALFLANGVTTVRNMSGAPFHLALQKQVESGQYPGPRIVTTSPTLEADDFMLPMWKYVNDPCTAEHLVDQYVKRGYQQIKVLNMLDAKTLYALGKACQKHNIHLTGHCPQAVTYEEAIEAGMRCFEHLLGIWKGHLTPGVSPNGQSNATLEVIEAMAHHLDYEAIRRLAHQMAKQDIWNCPTLVTDQFMLLPHQQGLTHPKIVSRLPYVPQIVLPLWEMLDVSRRQGENQSRWLAAVQGRLQASLKVINILHQEGAPLLIGTDTSVRFVIQGFSVHDELENFVNAGLTPLEALRCATSEPARFLGLASEMGTVTENRRADLILVEENPLDDIRALRELAAVFVNGFHLTRTDLNILLDEQASIAERDSFTVMSSRNIASDQGHLTTIQGNLIEKMGTTPRGKLAYRHQQRAAGGWSIEEVYEFEQNSIYDIGGRRLRRTQAQLGSDFSLEAVKVVEESFTGFASLEVRRTDTNGYLVRQEAEDGFVSTYKIDDTVLLVPDISLLITLPINSRFEDAIDGTHPQKIISFLPSIELERFQIGESTIVVVNNDQTDGKEIRVKSKCGIQTLEGIYQIHKDENLESCRYGWGQFVPDHT